MVALGVWQLLVSRGVSQLVLPSPTAVAAALWTGLTDPESTWIGHIGITLLEAGIGFALGCLLGVVLGAAFAFVPIVRDTLYPYMMALQTFPKIAIAPLLLVWVGYGLWSKVIVAVMLAFFPVMVNTAAGFSSVPRDEIESFASLRASTWQEFRYLRWPRCLGYLFPALETAVILALLGAISAEFVGAKSGLGYLLLQKMYLGEIAAMFAILLILALLGIVLYVLMGAISRRVLFWIVK